MTQTIASSVTGLTDSVNSRRAATASRAAMRSSETISRRTDRIGTTLPNRYSGRKTDGRNHALYAKATALIRKTFASAQAASRRRKNDRIAGAGWLRKNAAHSHTEARAEVPQTRAAGASSETCDASAFHIFTSVEVAIIVRSILFGPAKNA